MISHTGLENRNWLGFKDLSVEGIDGHGSFLFFLEQGHDNHHCTIPILI